MRINLGVLTFGAFSCFWGTGAGGTMGLELLTYDDLKDLLNLKGSLITEYPALDLLRDSVTIAFEEYLGRDLQSLERTETVFIGGSKTVMIKLRAIPISDIASLTITERGTVSTLTENSDFEVTNYGIYFYAPIVRCKVDITYTGGLAVTTEALTRGALLQVAYEFQSKEHIGSDHVSTEGGSVSRPALQLLKEVKRTINRERHPLVGGYL